MGWLVRWLPAGLGGRLVLILLAGLLVVQLVSVVLYVGERKQATIDLFARSVANRILTATPLLDAAAPGERRALAAAIDSPTLGVVLPDRGDRFLTRRWRQLSEERRQQIALILAPLGPRDIRTAVWIDDWRGRHWHGFDDDDDDEGERRRFGRHGPDRAPPDLLPSRRKMAISMDLRGGGRVIYVVASDLTSVRWALGMGLWIGASVLVIALFTFWAGRRVGKPFQRFAEAADRLGVDVEAPALEETGSAELRQASRAFNRMQARIRRMVEDRTMMLAAISHDLKTALTRLRLRAEFIEDETQAKKAEADLNEMQATLEASLSLARGDAAKESTVRLDLASLVTSLVDDARDAGADIAYKGPLRLDLRGRPTGLRRALANLIENARRYGAPPFEVELVDGGEDVTVQVSDSGPGIPDHEIERVFQPFHRLEGSRSRETGGVGLGLPIARSIARAHGGDLTLENAERGGLVATLRLAKVGT
ncbi:MAG: ATP-binding protein [Geminicoccaceae bacterium]